MEPIALGLGGAGVITPYLLKFLDWAKQDRDKKTKAEQDAIKAVSEALYETVSYINKRQVDGDDLDEERKLYKYWNIASDALRGVNDELSELCSMKGRYWLEPESWTHEDVINAGIEINKITDDIEVLKSKYLKK